MVDSLGLENYCTAYEQIEIENRTANQLARRGSTAERCLLMSQRPLWAGCPVAAEPSSAWTVATALVASAWRQLRGSVAATALPGLEAATVARAKICRPVLVARRRPQPELLPLYALPMR